MSSPSAPSGRRPARRSRPGCVGVGPLAFALAIVVAGPGVVLGAREPRPPQTPPPVSGAPSASSARPVIPVNGGDYAIDLNTALRLAEAENPAIAEARAGILVAIAEQQQARSLLLPSLNAGMNYHGHAGNLQRSSGAILDESLQSLYLGGGAMTLSAVSVAIPAVNIAAPLTDALFEPLAARRRLDGARAGAAAVANATLLEVATLYLDLLAAGATVEAQRRSEAEAAEVAAITAEFARSGEVRKADADRAETTRLLRAAKVRRAEEAVAVSSARLARRLNLDAAVRLRPLADAQLGPIALIDPSSPAEDLVRVALQRRPEMGAREAEVDVARVRVKEEVCRPLLPTLWVGLSGGAFGGGSNLSPPLLGRFAGRTDIDVAAYWTLQNLGVGNRALQRRSRAVLGQAVAERSATINQIRREVIAAQAEGLAAGPQVDYARRGLAIATEGFRDDVIRVREGQGRPIEALNNLGLLADSRLDLIRAITRYNRAQFTLFVALGSPPPLPPPDGPVDPPPIPTPLRSPIDPQPRR